MFDRALVRCPEATSQPAVRRRSALVLQAKLRVGSSSDPAEAAADRFADAVTGALRRGTSMDAACFDPSMPARIVRATTGRADVGDEGGDVPDHVARTIKSSRGEPLDERTRARMEPATGMDLAEVRIHRDSPAPSRIQASAFTVGSDIHFAPGEYRPATGRGQRLLSHELGHVAQQRGGAQIRRFTEQNDSDGDPWRVSESGKSALYQTQREGGAALYTTSDLIIAANKKLKKAGTNGSFVRLSVDDERGLKAGLLNGVSPDVRRVVPRLVTIGADPGNQKLKAINEGTSADDDGSQEKLFALWADCGRASRAVMGTDSAGPKPRASRTIGTTPAPSARSVQPASYTDIYKLAMQQFMAVDAHKQYLRSGVHYHKILAWKSFVKPSSTKEAKRLYWKLGEEGRKKFDEYTSTNLAADPEVGGAYTLVTEKQMPGFASAGRTWNFHWAAVVMKDGSNNITLENYAVSYGTDPDPVKQKALQQQAYDEVNRKYVFQMYGTVKKGQTFHEEHIASGTHGNRGSTFAVKV